MGRSSAIWPYPSATVADDKTTLSGLSIPSPLPEGHLVYVDTEGEYYRFSATSGAVVDGDEVLSTVAGGSTRWLKTMVARGIGEAAGPTVTVTTTGNVDDLDATESRKNAGAVRFTGTGTPTLRGVAGGDSTRRLVLEAVGGPLILANENAGSAAANRIVTGSGSDMTIGQGGAVLLVYDAVSVRWRVVGGGGGGSVTGGNKAVQFVDGSSAGGDATKFAYDKTLQSLAVGASALASGSNCFAFGLGAQATGTYSAAIGQGCVASAAGAFAAGEGCTASAANACAIGWSSTASGTYSQTLGSYCTASGNAAVAVGVNASAPRHGQFSHGSGHTGSQHWRMQLYLELNATSGSLQAYGGGSLSLEDNASYAIRVTVHAAKTDATSSATEVRQLLVRCDGGAASIVDNDLLVEQSGAGALAALGWSASYSTPSGLELRVSCNAGSDKVRFVADLDVVEIYGLTDAPAAFDPATLSLTLWLRGAYAGSPWTGVASAGSSGSHNLTEGTNPPGVGATLNGYATADFDGVNDILNGTTLGTYISASAGAGWALVYIDAIAVGSGAFGLDAIVGSQTSGYYAVELDSATPTVRHSIWDGADKTASKAVATGTWQLLTWRHDGSNVQVGVNEAPGAAGGASSVAAGNVGSTGNNLRLGTNPGGAFFFNGRIADIGMSNTALTNTDFANVKAYVNARYGLAL